MDDDRMRRPRVDPDLIGNAEGDKRALRRDREAARRLNAEQDGETQPLRDLHVRGGRLGQILARVGLWLVGLTEPRT